MSCCLTMFAGRAQAAPGYRPRGPKRVELHLHTKSSSMDGFNDPGKIVRLAHRMGHRAIAITDHGVCQGYPEAMLATDAIHETTPTSS